MHQPLECLVGLPPGSELSSALVAQPEPERPWVYRPERFLLDWPAVEPAAAPWGIAAAMEPGLLLGLDRRLAEPLGLVSVKEWLSEQSTAAAEALAAAAVVAMVRVDMAELLALLEMEQEQVQAVAEVQAAALALARVPAVAAE